jgi:hypothetical protein
MAENNCSLCAAGSKAGEVSGVFTHVVENMTEAGKPQLVVCADSPIKARGRLVALRVK